MRITSKGQVTIPMEIREKLGLLPDTEVEFELDGDSVRIRKAAGGSSASRAAGAGRTAARPRHQADHHRRDHAADEGLTSDGTLVDSNVLLDVLTEDDEWFDWSAAMLAEAARPGCLCS